MVRFSLIMGAVIFASASAWAAVPSAVERLRRFPTPANDCRALEAELRAATAPGMTASGPVIRENKIDWILRRLASLEFPQGNIADVLSRSLAEQPEAAFKELRRISEGECRVQVHRTLKVVISTAAQPLQDPALREKIIEGLRKWFRAPRVPTAARAMVDFEILRAALKQGLWKPGLERIHKVDREREALVSLIVEFNKAYFGTAEPKEASFEKADFQKLQPTLIREIKEASASIAWIGSFVADLH